MLPSVLETMTDEELALVRQSLLRVVKENQLAGYKPYAKQREFHKAGALHSARLFIAGNQLGKSLSGGAEWAIHLTGRYPDWWEGAVFDKPVKLWASSVTSDATRDNPQRVLVGPPAIQEAWGTGMIPKDALVSWHRAMGTANLLDSVLVRHGGGGDVQAGTSVCSFKHYAQGREKWQGPTLDGCWFDEECPIDIYGEGITRTNRGQRGQFIIMTFTPLLGMSEVVRMFLMEKDKTP